MKFNKLTVGICKKVNPSGEDLHYELEVEVEGRGELEEARSQVLTMLDSWLKESHLRGLDPKILEVLPWRNFRKKDVPAEKDMAGWLFADVEGIEKLVEAIEASENGCVRLAGFEYFLSGKNGKFVKRRPLRKRSKKATTSS